MFASSEQTNSMLSRRATIDPVRSAFLDRANRVSRSDRRALAEHEAWPQIEAAWVSLEGLATIGPTFAATIAELRAGALALLPRQCAWGLRNLTDLQPGFAADWVTWALPPILPEHSLALARELLTLDEAALAALAGECVAAFEIGVALFWPQIPGNHGPNVPALVLDPSAQDGPCASAMLRAIRFYPQRAAALYARNRAAQRLSLQLNPRLAAHLLSAGVPSERLGATAVHELLHLAANRFHPAPAKLRLERFRPGQDSWHALLDRYLLVSYPALRAQVRAVLWTLSPELLRRTESGTVEVVAQPLGAMALEEARVRLLEEILLQDPGIAQQGPALLWDWQPGEANLADTNTARSAYERITTLLRTIHGPETSPAELVRRLARRIDRRYYIWLLARVRRRFGAAAATAFLAVLLSDADESAPATDQTDAGLASSDWQAARFARALGLDPATLFVR